MERKKFIRLHRTPDNSSLLVSADDILYVDAGVNDRKNARITLKDPRVASFYVNESPDKIYRMLEEE